MDIIIDLITGIVGGIISGIISGVLVTKVYRQIDSKRERILIFTSAKTFISQFLSIDSHDFDELYKFVQCNFPPIVYKWSPLKEDEREMFDGLRTMFNALRLELSAFFMEKNMHKIDKNYPYPPDLEFKEWMSILSFQSQMRQVGDKLSSLEKEGKW